ncbi:hypothetical protein QQF64_027509 [Cirrhinus molitorella]|uniref:DUF6729 domain-containing protein n=2 Tax=Cirrhinus molitorella TaxID=172907 RepID=A0ABR3NCL0_9TELE
MYAYPFFRRQSATSSRLLMAPSSEAKRLENVESGRAKPKEEVLTEAKTFVSTNGGDPSDQFLVLAHCKLQFGKYQGQRFRWLLENSLGYAVYLVLSISQETAQTTPLSENKQLFLQYTSHIREMAEEVEKYERKQEMQAEARASGDQGCLMVEFGDFQGRSMKDVYEDQSKEAQSLIRYLVKADARPNTNMAIFKTYVLKRQASALGTSVRQPARPLATSSISGPPPAASSISARPLATSSISAPPPAASSISARPPATSSISAPPPAASTTSAPSPAAIRTGVQQITTVKALLAHGKRLSSSQLAKKLKSPVKHYPSLQPTLPPTAAEPLARRQLFATGTSVLTAEDDDEELVFAASQCEAQLNTACAGPATTPALPHHQPPAELPGHWKDHLPPFQHEWIRNTLFKANPRTGKPELVSQLKLWWYPPQPPLIHTQPPASPDLFFCRPFFLWMPLKMWLFPLVCVRPDCGKHRLTAAGLYRTVRKVLDIDGWYDLATEYLECKCCKKKYPAWSEDILGQLDMGHRSQFPALLTYRYSCDNRVLRMMRERTLGNSVTQLYKKLMEQHSEAWTQRVLQYLTACEPFTRSSLVQPPVFAEPPLLPALPKPKWLLAVYARDVLGRLHEVKAKITSVLGCVLKMDSTKKVTKKLAGAASGTAAWCTNVGNEHGQVLVSVLTAAEGHGLDAMAAGLMKRYRDAGEAAPKVMYVDRDCCNQHGQSRVKVMFSEWDELEVRLDIWHFMRRFAAGVTTEAHPLYGIFMARLSACIFLWDPEDVAALRRAKEGELVAKKTGHISERAISARITRRELALHCRRRTRGVEETTRLIGALIDLFDSAEGKDTLGVPLLDHERIQQIWKEQQKHVQCVQDPENFPLYSKTGTLKKGGVELCCYRCARGSTSLESFHLHLNRFIPGTSASDAHFQAYLLEGLMRWNDDRMEDAIKGASSIRSYGSAMREAVDRLSRSVLGKPWDERYRPPGAFTGELLGIEYLYSQTGKTLTAVPQNPEEEDRLVEEVDDQDLEDEGFEEEIMEDITVPVLYEDDPCHDLENRPSSLPLPQSPASPAEPSTSSGGEGQHLAPAPSVLFNTGSSISDEAQGAAIGPDGIAGWDKVQDLAGYLVGLREAPYLTDLQVTAAIQLWTALPDSDKQRINYQPRHQPQLTHGRFKAPKRSGVTPGVESVKRCLIGHPGGPAQWPSTSRLVEAICVKLCTLHKSPTKKAGVCTPRWSKILSDYHHIRELVLNSRRLMDETMIQLFELNQKTLIQWFQRRQKNQEMSVLAQGLTSPDPIAVADTQLPPPREKLDEAPSTSGPRHPFILPSNREGQAPILRPGRRPAATKECPIAPAPPSSGVVQAISAPAPLLGTLVLNPDMTVAMVIPSSGASTSSAGPAPPPPVPPSDAPVSRYTQRNRRRRALETESGVHKRKYVRGVAFNTCSKCGQPKTKEFGHSRFGNATFCPRASNGKSLDDWLAEQRQQNK